MRLTADQLTALLDECQGWATEYRDMGVTGDEATFPARMMAAVEEVIALRAALREIARHRVAATAHGHMSDMAEGYSDLKDIARKALEGDNE